jgi:L-ascorbate oxidase
MHTNPLLHCLRSIIVIILGATLAACGGSETHSSPVPAASDELREPIVLSSKNGVLDVLMVAKAAPVSNFSPYRATGWVYVICPRPQDGSNSCPTVDGDPNYYGGTRLQVEPGDTLKIHLVNALPPTSTAKHALEDGQGFLSLNPTNLHVHGMLVSPRVADANDQSWGDSVFVLNFNSANGNPAPSDTHLHGTVQHDAVDYTYVIPENHPSGVFWFHPHVHGISLNQISAGMAGIITVGQVSDYLCTRDDCNSFLQSVPQRHLILKDAQILQDGTLKHQIDPNFCQTADPNAAPGIPGQGSCAGTDTSAAGGSNYTGGRWFFTLNGQAYPSLTVGSPAGQIWRIANTSASATYDLNLWAPDEKRQMLMRIVSIDGVSVDAGTATSASQLVDQAGNKFDPVPCQTGAKDLLAGVCTTRLHLMPSSRAEIWVNYRDANGTPQSPPAGARAIFRTAGYQTGPTGDNWPAADLAKVRFVDGPVIVGDLYQHAQARALHYPVRLAAELRRANEKIQTEPDCTALAPGHKRRIFFNVPSDNPNGFGLGYEEIDQNGVPVPGTFIDVHPFDPATPTVCLPLANGNAPSVERWELVNLAGEDHNFHIHQMHFSVLSAAEVASTALPEQLGARAVMMDNLPLAHADGTCNTVDDWRNGVCTAHVATVEIPFAITGDFVYHCHILEHEDGGMMAVIRVRPYGATQQISAIDRLIASLGLKQATRQTSRQFYPTSGICRGRKTNGQIVKVALQRDSTAR